MIVYIIFLTFTFLILAFAFYQWQYFMVFSPTYHRDNDICSECEILSITTDDGVELEGVIYEPEEVQRTLLVFLGRSHDCVGVINKLARTYVNIRIISFNYRSYGRSEGEANEQNLLQDSLKIAELVQKNYGNFYLLGYSLGSNIASYLASKHKCEQLFLVGAFDSMASLAKSKFVDRSFFPMIDLSKLFRYKFRTREYVQKIDTPTYLFVSKSDKTTYIENARELQTHVKNLVYYHEFDNVSHKELLWDSEVIDKINRVLNDKNFST